MGVNISKMLMSVGAGGAATLLIYSLWKGDRPFDGPRAPILGLRNYGNTCFLNAILQALASCRFMIGWLRQKDEDCNFVLSKPVGAIQSYSGVSYPLIAALFRAILIMNREIEVDDNVYAGKAPSDVLTGLRYNGHRIGFQQEQDAYEVFVMMAMALNHEVELSVRRKQTGSMGILTDGIALSKEESQSPTWQNGDNFISQVSINVDGDEWAMVGESKTFRVTDRIYSKRPVAVQWDYRRSPKNPFHYFTFSQMQCIVCMSKTTVRLESADSLTLTLPTVEVSARLSLEDLMLKQRAPILVHNVDCETCTLKMYGECTTPMSETRSTVKSTFFKYNYIGKLPNSLCIHIPRCIWGPYGMIKRSDYVAFPERINMAFWKRLYDSNKEAQQNIEASNQNTNNSENDLRRFKNSEYQLMAVISHYGSDVDNGHFVTFRRIITKDYPSQSSWYYISDDVVQSVPLSCVLGTRAYMLFYEKTHAHE